MIVMTVSCQAASLTHSGNQSAWLDGPMLHGFWSPGSGLMLWRDPGADALLPAAPAGVLCHRFRHRVHIDGHADASGRSVVVACRENDKVVPVDQVDEPVFLVDAPRSGTGQRVAEQFGLPGPGVGIAQDRVDQLVDPFGHTSVGALPVEVVIPAVGGKGHLHRAVPFPGTAPSALAPCCRAGDERSPATPADTRS